MTNVGVVSTFQRCAFTSLRRDKFVLGVWFGVVLHKTLHIQHLLWNVFSKTYIRLYIKLSDTNHTKRHRKKRSGEKVWSFFHCLSLRDTLCFLAKCHANSIPRNYSLDVVVGESSKSKAPAPGDVEPTKPNNPSSDCISADTGRI